MSKVSRRSFSNEKSRFGTFLGCSNYPKCTYTEKIKKSNTKKDKEQE